MSNANVDGCNDDHGVAMSVGGYAHVTETLVADTR